MVPYFCECVDNERVECKVYEPLVLCVEPQLTNVCSGDLGSVQLNLQITRHVEKAVSVSVRLGSMLVLKLTTFKIYCHNVQNPDYLADHIQMARAIKYRTQETWGRFLIRNFRPFALSSNFFALFCRAKVWQMANGKNIFCRKELSL